MPDKNKNSKLGFVFTHVVSFLTGALRALANALPAVFVVTFMLTGLSAPLSVAFALGLTIATFVFLGTFTIFTPQIRNAIHNFFDWRRRYLIEVRYYKNGKKPKVPYRKYLLHTFNFVAYPSAFYTHIPSTLSTPKRIHNGLMAGLSLLIPIAEIIIAVAGTLSVFKTIAALFLSVGIVATIPAALPILLSVLLGVAAGLSSLSFASVKIRTFFSFEDRAVTHGPLSKEEDHQCNQLLYRKNLHPIELKNDSFPADNAPEIVSASQAPSLAETPAMKMINIFNEMPEGYLKNKKLVFKWNVQNNRKTAPPTPLTPPTIDSPPSIKRRHSIS